MASQFSIGDLVDLKDDSEITISYGSNSAVRRTYEKCGLLPPYRITRIEPSNTIPGVMVIFIEGCDNGRHDLRFKFAERYYDPSQEPDDVDDV
jgi:hypothetical protein